MIVRPLLVTGIALASTGALVAGTPVPLPAQPTSINATAAAPLPAKLSLTADELKLLASVLYAVPLSELTLDEVLAAFDGEYGPWIGEDDVYYPTSEPSAPSGFVGLSYFLTDATLLSLVDANIPLLSDAADFAFNNVTTYYFEVGGAAALHVALAEATGGPDTPFGQLLQQIFNPGAAQSVQSVGTFAAPAFEVPTLSDIVAVFNEGYGGWIDDTDPYYPTSEPVVPSGFVGVVYFLTDETLWNLSEANLPVVSDAANFVYNNVTSYFFEVGAAAALHVSLAEATGGPDTPFAQVLQQIFNPSAAQAVSLNTNLAQDFSIQSRGSAEALTGNSPTDVPKVESTLVNLSEDGEQQGGEEEGGRQGAVTEPEDPGTEASDPEEPGTEADSNADEPEQPVKKKPQLNVKKVNPLADLGEKLNDVKQNVDKTLKAVGDGVSQLVGGGSKVTTPDEAAGSKVETNVDNEPKDAGDDQSAKKDAA